MNRWSLIAKLVVGLVVLWLVVFGVKAVLAPHQATPERVEEIIAEASFEDLSGFEDRSSKKRIVAMEEVASVVNRLDLSGQQEARDSLQGFFSKLSTRERRQFVELTAESFNRFFEALDALNPDARRDFIERGLRELESGATEERLQLAMEKDPQILEQIVQNGMKAYFQNASAETKMELAPFMKATNEVMQGCLLYTSPSPRDKRQSRMPSSA